MGAFSRARLPLHHPRRRLLLTAPSAVSGCRAAGCATGFAHGRVQTAEGAALGKLSKSTASRMCEELRARSEAFNRRDL
jgi:hypothetical protein